MAAECSTSADLWTDLNAFAERFVLERNHQGLDNRLITKPAVPGNDSAPVALIVLAIEHLAELDGPLTALATWLRPGATLRLLELHPDRIAAGTVAHFHADGVEQRFASVAHPVPQLVETLGRCGFEIVTVDELLAEGPLLELAPRLAKHRGHPVVLDLVARRSGR